MLRRQRILRHLLFVFAARVSLLLHPFFARHLLLSSRFHVTLRFLVPEAETTLVRFPAGVPGGASSAPRYTVIRKPAIRIRHSKGRIPHSKACRVPVSKLVP